VALVAAAAEAPFEQIVRSAAADPSVLADRVRRAGGSTGFDAISGTCRSMIGAGILDPVDVVIMALQIGAQAACDLLDSFDAQEATSDGDSADARPTCGC
jgi:chaperonin GroEL (HSP60 family)